MKSIKMKKAQQLVEFLFVAPLLIIFLGILTEYAYALNINMTITKALKTVTASLYSEIKPSMSQSDIETLTKSNFLKYLDDNNVPINAENSISVGYVPVGSTAIFMARYTYIPAFTLPNVWFKFMPDQFDFFATAAVPSALLGENNYDSSITSQKLDNIWSATANFSSPDAFNASKKGIMKDTAGRNNILFMVPSQAPNLISPYALVNWDATIKKDPVSGNDFALDMENGKFYTCTATACNQFGQTFYNYITDNNYYNLFFVAVDDAPTDITFLNSLWLDPAGTIDISETSVQGLLKNLLSVTKNNKSIGNYDNIKVVDYNPALSTSNTYNMNSYGSFVIMSSTEDITKIGATTKAKAYDFGSRVN